MEAKTLSDARCKGLHKGKTCDRLLGQFDKASGLIKCPRCGTLNVVAIANNGR